MYEEIKKKYFSLLMLSLGCTLLLVANLDVTGIETDNDFRCISTDL